MLKIINSYYYNINNNIYKYLNRVMTMFKIKIIKNILALDFVFVSCYNTNFNNNIGGIYANS